MPELPDIELYLTRIGERVTSERFEAFEAFNPFVLRSATPTPSSLAGRVVTGVSRLGKRIVIELDNEAFIVIHLMIAGRLQWQATRPEGKKPMGRVILAQLRFSSGVLHLQEASTKKRAGIHFVGGSDGLAEHRRNGLNVITAKQEEFAARIVQENRTLKRALTSPHLFDGIGNAYSDEILFHARLSPLRLTRSLSTEETERLRVASVETLTSWRYRLLDMYPGFPRPADITAFRPEFCVHGRYREPCRECGAPVQHIVYAENETNYCAQCQNEGRLLADRSLSRLLKSDWPKTLEEMLGN